MEPKIEKKAYPVLSSEYKLLEEVGQGVSAIVYRALCIPFNEIVAVKALDLERCNSNLDDIRKEAQTMSLINHPNVMKAYCSFVVDHSLWVVMPFMAGGSCLHIMKSAYPDGFEEPIIATFLKDSLKALEYLHCHGHIHRDVKAGNILVDSNGTVKLGDFGVSACMFDTGDRQRSRNTFVGTPCWMAPEVMEQVHGYDFKADMWSFGITALELAHGHAPFAKYPPMKVLLMTLQNAPPGLDYERDKKFSKSFKEMIAMCLVKDPIKRPTAEKLLKHSFFKQARSADHIVRSILAPLPPLWERVKELKKKDAARLAQKKMPYGEQEEKSQNEYKRGVSCWNFDVDDLKAQASLIQNDGDAVPLKDGSDSMRQKENDNVSELPQKQSLSPQQTVNDEGDIIQIPVTIHSLKAETATDAGERVTRVRSGPLPTPVSSKFVNGSRSGPLPSGKKEPKHIGRFDVFEDDTDGDASEWQDASKTSQCHKHEKDQLLSEKNLHNKLEADNASLDEKEQKVEKESKKMDERIHEQGDPRRALSSSLVAERAVSSSKGSEDEREREVRGVGKGSEESRLFHQPKDRAFAGPPPSGSVSDQRQASTAHVPSKQPAGQKETPEEKLKGTVIQKKGRFSVTHDVDAPEGVPASGSRKNAAVQTSSIHKSSSDSDWQSEKKNGGALPVPKSQSPEAVQVAPPGLSVSVILPHLQSILTQTTLQQDLIVNLMNQITSGDSLSANRPGYPGSKSVSRTASSTGSAEPMAESSTERERELLSQAADLQCRVVTLEEELQSIKLKNVQLERKLNAIYNKEEEERIRREEAAREDG